MALSRNLVLLLLALAPSAAVRPDVAPRDDEALIRKRIEIFLAEPLADTSADEVAAIAVFADESETVAVKISSKICPWTLSEMDAKAKEILVAAYLAGNVRSQLDTATKQDDSYSGMVQVLRVYRALKEQDPKFRDASLDQYATMQAKGELNQHILDLRDEAAGKPKKGAPPPPKDKKKP